jgi:hypothetical protein
MIIVNLKGGLGNQMFQYAAGKALALEHNTNLKLDLLWFNTISKIDTVRTYDLSCFSIPTDSIASAKELKKIKQKIFLLKIVKKIYPSFSTSVFSEKHYNYDPNFLSFPANAYITGYWQSFRYFEQFAEYIQKDFTFTTPMNIKNQIFSELILTTSSVSIHIRRGDYITNTHANSFHGTTSLEYYYEAVKYIGEYIKNPNFFIFSDDIQWVKENLSLSYPTIYIDHNQMAFEDMRLMSLCKHNIIANSSFSWWGAWLNQNSEKIVIAPKKWFNDSSINTIDLIPKSWVQL